MLNDITEHCPLDDMHMAVREFGRMLDVDKIEARISQFPEATCPVEHEFVPGMYIRSIAMPAGTLLTSKIHKTEHPYFVMEGQCLVWTQEGGAQHIMAPHRGITKPGTRRIIFILEDSVWVTCHPITEEEFGNLQMIEDRIIEKHHNPLLNGSRPCLN
jgi:hypothetical protein